MGRASGGPGAGPQREVDTAAGKEAKRKKPPNLQPKARAEKAPPSEYSHEYETDEEEEEEEERSAPARPDKRGEGGGESRSERKS